MSKRIRALYTCAAPKLEVLSIKPDGHGEKVVHYRYNGNTKNSILHDDRMTGERYFRAGCQRVYVRSLRKVQNDHKVVN